MKRLLPIAVAAAVLALYAGAVLAGLRLGDRSLADVSGAWLGRDFRSGPQLHSWQPAPVSAIENSRQDLVLYGQKLFTETPVYDAAHTGSRIACGNCHLQAGTAPYASPVVGLAGQFPMYSKRSGRSISLEDRIQECMTRSENGVPLAPGSRELKAYVAYIDWLSEPHRQQAAFVGRGLKMLRPLTPDPQHGAEVYAAQCAGCHGANGEGARRPFPPLWGPQAFNDGAGMGGIDKMAAFVRYNMPQNRKGVLSAQDAYDVAAFIHTRPRPAYNHAYDIY